MRQSIDMRCAFLIQCHKNPRQVMMLINALQDKDFDFYVHIDAKSNLDESVLKGPNVYLIPKLERVNVEWSKLSQVDATLKLIEAAFQNHQYDYYCLLSGQDYPIKSTKAIKEKLCGNQNTNYIDLCGTYETGERYAGFDKRNSLYYPHWMFGRTILQRVLKRAYIELTGGMNKTFPLFARKTAYRFFFGSSWWCLSGDTIKWMIDYLKKDKDFYRYYQNCICPDESFFQTLFMMSPEKNRRDTFLHYICWVDQSSPIFLTSENFDGIAASDKLFARKFDMELDSNIIALIDSNLR